MKPDGLPLNFDGKIIGVWNYSNIVNPGKNENMSNVYCNAVLGEVSFGMLDMISRGIYLNILFVKMHYRHSHELLLDSNNKAITVRSVLSSAGGCQRTDYLCRRFLRLIDVGLIYLIDEKSGKRVVYDKQDNRVLSRYPLEWNDELRTQIRKRDQYLCQICHKDGWPVHHINYNKNDCRPINLITLCKKCHTKTNTNREHWHNYLERLLNGK